LLTSFDPADAGLASLVAGDTWTIASGIPCMFAHGGVDPATLAVADATIDIFGTARATPTSIGAVQVGNPAACTKP
jgi:hypothetical protein